MMKYVLIGMFLLGANGQAATVVETEAVQKAKGICTSIIQSTTLEQLPQDVILSQARKPFDELSVAEKEHLTASAYATAVDELKSRNIDHDVQQALAWYARASLDKDLYAFFRLGILLAEWENQQESSVILIQAAADLGEHHARVYLGLEKEDY
jgi:TPR repeat protein